MTRRDPYSLLGVEPTASSDEVRQAFLRMTRLVHPDRFDSDKQPQEWRDANDLLKAINEAYSILRDPARRSEFDHQRRSGTARPEDPNRPEPTPPQKPKSPPTGTGAESDPSHGHANFAALPEKVRMRLLDRQKGKVKEQYWVATDTFSSYFLTAGFFSLWFPVLAALAANRRWNQSSLLWILVVSVAVGLLLGLQLDWFIRRIRSPLGPRLYVTPLYLVETAFEAVRWWPLWTIRDLKVTHHFRNGSHQYTQIRLQFPDSEADFSIAHQGDAEAFLKTLQNYDQHVRKVAAEKDWAFFATQDDFSGVAKGALRAPERHSRTVGLVAGLVVALVAYGGAAVWNRSLAHRSSLPPADRQLPDESQAFEDPFSQLFAEPGNPAPAFAQPELPLPRNGALDRFTAREAIAPLEIRTRGAEHNYFIKLVDSATEAPVLTVFVRGGQSVALKVPLGRVKMRYAVGSKWYGERFLFGPRTSYAQADSEFDFSVHGDQISGYTVELFLQANGNLRERALRPDQW